MNVYIETERLVIRDLEKDDALQMYEYRIDPSIQKYQSFCPKSVYDVVEFIRDNEGKFNSEDDWFQVGIKYNDKLIGDIGIHFIGPNNLQCEIGYTIGPNYQNKGFGNEALIGVVNYLFVNLKKHRIIASLDPTNIASIRLLEKVGFRKEGLFKKSIFVDGRWEDDLIYALLNEEWKR